MIAAWCTAVSVFIDTGNAWPLYHKLILVSCQLPFLILALNGLRTHVSRAIVWSLTELANFGCFLLAAMFSQRRSPVSTLTIIIRSCGVLSKWSRNLIILHLFQTTSLLSSILNWSGRKLSCKDKKKNKKTNERSVWQMQRSYSEWQPPCQWLRICPHLSLTMYTCMLSWQQAQLTGLS